FAGALQRMGVTVPRTLDGLGEGLSAATEQAGPQIRERVNNVDDSAPQRYPVKRRHGVHSPLAKLRRVLGQQAVDASDALPMLHSRQVLLTLDAVPVVRLDSGNSRVEAVVGVGKWCSRSCVEGPEHVLQLTPQSEP